MSLQPIFTAVGSGERVGVVELVLFLIRVKFRFVVAGMSAKFVDWQNAAIR